MFPLNQFLNLWGIWGEWLESNYGNTCPMFLTFHPVHQTGTRHLHSWPCHCRDGWSHDRYLTIHFSLLTLCVALSWSFHCFLSSFPLLLTFLVFFLTFLFSSSSHRLSVFSVPASLIFTFLSTSPSPLCLIFQTLFQLVIVKHTTHKIILYYNVHKVLPHAGYSCLTPL